MTYDLTTAIIMYTSFNICTSHRVLVPPFKVNLEVAEERALECYGLILLPFTSFDALKTFGLLWLNDVLQHYGKVIQKAQTGL